MKLLPLDPAAHLHDPAALIRLLEDCRETARARQHAQLVSITLPVDSLDPLAVLESIFSPTELHAYIERPSAQLALAGADAILAHTAHGPDRFASAQRFIADTLAHTLLIGDQSAPFAGPHFLSSFTFADSPATDGAFPAAQLFVPRWQVGQHGGRTTAVANLLITADAPVEPHVARLLRALEKFHRFDYAAPEFTAPAVAAPTAVVDAYPEKSYISAVACALGHIADGTYRKIVLARARDLAAATPFHPLRVLNGLRQRYPDCYAFSFANARGQSFIGASPERLLRIQDNTLTTEALAGSAPRGATASEDAFHASALLRSEKDLREHRHVIDSITRRLTPLGLTLEHADRPALLRLANLHHLHTPITAPLPANIDAFDILSRLHPTPAVGGSPRENALPHIAALEGFDRGLYAGALGWINAHGQSEFFVGLRSALIDGPRARLYAGAGIVEGSAPEKELSETNLKFRALQEALLA